MVYLDYAAATPVLPEVLDSYNKVTEDYLKNLRQHTEKEFKERKRWTRQYWIRDSIKKTLKDVDEWFSENPELKKKLKEAFALVKDIKEPPSMF